MGGRGYAATGRASPDVASLGERFAVVYDCQTIAVGGTFASTLSWGAVISSLILRLAHGYFGLNTVGIV